jgi:hypothetical protein
MRYYSGIGSRKTPKAIIPTIEEIATLLDSKGYTLRSGGADGADTFFEDYSTTKEIYLPWKSFNNNESELYLENIDPEIVTKAEEISKKFHPRWNSLNKAGRSLMTRNVFQVLGMDLKTPADFIVCWTETGKIEGGTGQAMRIARNMGIPIFNLFFYDAVSGVKEFLYENKI